MNGIVLMSFLCNNFSEPPKIFSEPRSLVSGLPSFFFGGLSCSDGGRHLAGNDERLVAPAQGGGKEVVVATLAQAQFFAQVGHPHREVAHGQVGAVRQAAQPAQVLLTETAYLLHRKAAAGKVGSPHVGGVEVAVGVERPDTEAAAQRLEGARLHDGRIRLVEVGTRSVGQQERGLLLLGGAETEVEAAAVARVLQVGCRLAPYHQQQFLALAVDREDVHLLRARQLRGRLADVEHGRELEQEAKRQASVTCQGRLPV